MQFNQTSIYISMKASKSKGRITEAAPRPPPPESKRRSRRVKRQKGPQNPRRVITVHYLKKKINFTITQLDPQLGRALVLAFGNTNYRLTLSSLLLELKANWTRLENTYSHTLDLKQALNLYTFLTRKRRGEASPMRQMEELEAIMKSYTLESKDLEGDLEEERIQLNKEIEQVRRGIKTIYVKMRQEIKNNFLTSEDYFKASLLEWRIRELGRDLINLMIVAVQEVDIDKVEITFEHPYPQRSCSRQYLFKFLGQERYNAKKIDLVRHYRTARLNSCRNTSYIVCHMCRQPITGVYIRCRKKYQDPLEPNIYNSPNVYQRHLLSVDYLYTNFDQVLTEKQLDEELDYFKYYPTLAGRHACNRFICQDCMERHVVVYRADQVLNYVCQFCTRICQCQSCTIARQLIKSLALYKHILKNNFQQLDDYYQLIKFVNLNHESVESFMHTRCSFEAASNKQHEYTYYAGIDEFGNINEVIAKMQSQAVRCFPILADTGMMISNYMAQVRDYILSERGNLEINPLPSGRKYLSTVRQDNRAYLDLLEDRKERDRFEELSVMTRLPTRLKEFKTKLRHIAAMFQSENISVLEPPFEPYEISPEEMFIEQQQREGIALDLAVNERPLQPEGVRRLIYGKNEIPFDESDYQIAINVKPECKIPDQNEIYLQKALEERIFYPDNHKIHGFRATKICRFHEDAEEFCNLIEDSDTSSEDEESLDDLYLDKAPSVSVSSFLEGQCKANNYGVADDLADVSNYDSANSSFIFIEQSPFTQEGKLNRQEEKSDKDDNQEDQS